MIHAILNTRPTHQSHHLTHLLQTAGHIVFQLPLLEIDSVPFKPIKMDDFDIIIFLSANAVNHFFHHNDKMTTRSTLIAIGPATQLALEKLSFAPIHLPDFFSSEGLVTMPLLQHVRHKKIAIISGENPNPFLQQTLTMRGAQIQNILCYMRQPISHDIEIAFSVIKKNKIDCVICTSSESLAQLMRLFNAFKHRQWLLEKILCVISDKMKQEAADLGFHNIIQAKNATDDAMLQAISGAQKK